MCEAVGLCSCFDDGSVESEAVDDRGAEPRVRERVGPTGEGLIRRDRDAVLLFPLGEDLEQEFGASAIEFHVAEFIDQEQVDATVAGDGAVQLQNGTAFMVAETDDHDHHHQSECADDKKHKATAT